jgi:uncharacterized Fe-S cluster-containing protein
MQPVTAVKILVSNLMVLRSYSNRVVSCNVTNYLVINRTFRKAVKVHTEGTRHWLL